jgi:hypothetical protein
VAIGRTDEISTRTARAVAKEYLAQITRGQHPKAEKQKAGIGGEGAGNDTTATLPRATLKQAWERYRENKRGFPIGIITQIFSRNITPAD